MDEKLRKLERLAASGDPDAITGARELKQRLAYSVNYSQPSARDAHTLDPEDLGPNESGWTISGDICEDYYTWVNDFEATHEKLGEVWGDFEDVVYATTKAALDHFLGHHPPSQWDYWDI
jgi:hypothetical protein